MLQPDFEGYVQEICKGIKSRPRREEVMEELLCHLEDNYERNLAVGMNGEEAKTDAIAKMGDGKTLAYRLSAVNSQSPLRSMSSAFFALVAGYLCLNFFIKGIVDSVLFFFSVAFMFSALLRMRKMNSTMEKAFHFFNFFIITRVALYCLQTGRDLNVYVFCAVGAFAFVIQGIFWVLLFEGLFNFTKIYVKKDRRMPGVSLCQLYHFFVNALAAYLVAISEGKEISDLPFFILPWIIVFMYFFGTVQLIRMRNVLWDADSEYGILPGDKKHFAVFTGVIATVSGAILIFNYASSTMSPVKTELIIHDVSESERKEADIVRQKMLSWDVDPQIVEDLPDSEILNYKDAEFVTWGADGGSMGGSTNESGAQSDLLYYWFFVPDEDFPGDYRVRLLCYIESHYTDSIKSFYRKGFYYVPWGDGFYPLNLKDELNGSFISIITDENGKKYNAEPFFTYRLKDTQDGYPTDYPKGFEYREEKGQRVYYATQLGVTNLGNRVSMYAASVRQRWFVPMQYCSTAGYIKTVMTTERITSTSGDYHPFHYRLHNIATGNFDDKAFSSGSNKSYKYENGYPE